MIRSSIFRLLLILAISTSALVMHAQQATAIRDVDLKAPDGANLKATFFAAEKPGPGVMLLHQCNSQRKIWDDLAKQLSAAGINVLTLDLRGFGESDGTPQDKSTPQQAQAQAQKWPGDIDVAFNYLTSQPGVKPDIIGVGGASCGVTNSLQVALRHPKQVKSLVLLSGPADLAGRRFLRQTSQLPVLAAIADDDEFPPSNEATELIFSQSSNPGNRFLRYANGGHGAEIFRVHPELRTAIVDWYVTTLIKTPGHAPAAERWQAPPVVQMLALIDQPGGAAQAQQKLVEARKHDPKAVLFPETMVNIMGYEHLQAGDTQGAVDILKLNATAFPDSPNVYDSLSDAYLAAGQKDLARENAKKAIELLASDTADPEARRNAIRDSAEQKLKQLGPAPN
ncbi:MAG TPA: alpha/beta fold hydrolase [Candidatus Angelobacter sp.]|nr:alpha/beta fold hydrolase [Candidatus Angelobacter sp.]